MSLAASKLGWGGHAACMSMTANKLGWGGHA